jgi:hypothetical protein
MTLINFTTLKTGKCFDLIESTLKTMADAFNGRSRGKVNELVKRFMPSRPVTKINGA